MAFSSTQQRKAPPQTKEPLSTHPPGLGVDELGERVSAASVDDRPPRVVCEREEAQKAGAGSLGGEHCGCGDGLLGALLALPLLLALALLFLFLGRLRRQATDAWNVTV